MKKGVSKRVSWMVVIVALLSIAFVVGSFGGLTGNAIISIDGVDYDRLPPGCTSSTKCALKQGDCDNDLECNSGLYCKQLSPSVSNPRGTDFCIAKEGSLSKVTYQGVAEMFGNSVSTGQIRMGREGMLETVNGRIACGSEKECLLGIGGIVHPDTQYFNYDVTGLFTCDQTININEAKAHNDWIEGSIVSLQYLCIPKEVLKLADSGLPESTGSGSLGGGTGTSRNSERAYFELSHDNVMGERSLCGELYKFELVSASDTSATIKVTDSSGHSETKEVTEDDLKDIQGVSIRVINADETNLSLKANFEAIKNC